MKSAEFFTWWAVCPIIGASSPARCFATIYVGELTESTMCCNGIFCLCIFGHL
jgi:hypothetical protein